ncbi:hypothetical protein HO173_013404 [Letharia columbiana]|uniref:Uncharacterized protein n=1 Tax=Letharia columbiana TaxID=112416 RepID=A0A8H6CFY2_9LECA|nr:uncharacterized protein HO173_013404 [Letharia columbiana]KAF6222496.1 hypothetical protein HO173_013404 [Letharia columbiana]
MTTGSDAPCDYSTLPSPTSWNCASSTITGGPILSTGTDGAVAIALPSALQSAIVSYAQSDTCAASKARNKRSSCDVGTLGADIIGQTGTGGLFIDLIQFPTGAQLPALIPAVAVGLSQVVTARTGNRSTSALSVSIVQTQLTDHLSIIPPLSIEYTDGILCRTPFQCTLPWL